MLLLVKGIKQVQANPVTGRILIHYTPEQITLTTIKNKIKEILSLPKTDIQHGVGEKKHQDPKMDIYELEELPIWSQGGLTATTSLLLLANHLRKGDSPRFCLPSTQIFLDSGSLLAFFTGIPIFKTALDHLLKEKKLSTELLAGITSLFSLFVDENNFSLLVLLLVYLNTLIRTLLLESVRDRIRLLMEKREPVARLKTSKGGTVVIPGNRLAEGAMFQVQSCDLVYGGSLLVKGSLVVKAQRVAEQTRAARLIQHLKQETKDADSESVRLLNTLSLLALTTAGGYYYFRRDVRGALNLLAVGLPAATGLARVIPAELGALRASPHGALVKSGRGITQLGQADVLLIGNGIKGKDARNLRSLDYGLKRLPKWERSVETIDRLQDWQGKGSITGMVGSRDVPPLSASDVGIVESSDSGLKLKSASIILNQKSPQALGIVASLAKGSEKIARQNVEISLTTALAGLTLGVFNLLTPLTTGLIQNFSTLVILGNSCHLLLPIQSVDKNRKVNPKPGRVWNDLSEQQIIDHVKTNPQAGLTSSQVFKRQKLYGPNQLTSGGGPTVYQIFFKQLDNYMGKVLLGLAGLSLIIGKPANALLSSGVLLTNTAFAVQQDRQARRSLKTLTTMTSTKTKVVRANKVQYVANQNLVPGDIILIQGGEQVPADARLLQSEGLLVEEASLTGESIPVTKGVKTSGSENWIYMGTKIIAGHGKGVVIHTGWTTKVGQIAANIGVKNYYSASPIYSQLDQVGQTLVYCGVGASTMALLAGFINKTNLADSIVNATSLAVSVIPDGLLPMITMTLALTAMKLVKKGVLIQHLPAVETLLKVAILSSKNNATEKGEQTREALLFAISNIKIAQTNEFTSNNGTPIKGTPGEILQACNWSLHNGQLRRLGYAEQAMVLKQAEKMTKLGARVLAFAQGDVFVGIISMKNPLRTEALQMVKASRQAGITTIMLTGDGAQYDNIRKSLRYALSTNLSDAVGIIWSTLRGKSISLEPLQLLWINLTSDPLISWILANDQAHPWVMNKPARKINESVFSGGLGRRIVSNSLISGFSGILVDNWSRKRGDAQTISRTLAMATATLRRMWQLSDIRKIDPTYLGKLPPNPLLPLAAVWMLMPLGAALYHPWLRAVLRTSPLSLKHWQLALIGSTTGFVFNKALNGVLNASIKPSHKFLPKPSLG